MAINLSLNGWLWALLETPNQYFLVKAYDGVKFLKHGQDIFKMGSPAQEIFLLVLYVSFDFMPETIHKDFEIAKAFT